MIVVSLLEFELTINFLNLAFLLLVNDQTYGRNKAIVEHNYLLGTGFLTKMLSFQNTRHFTSLEIPSTSNSMSEKPSILKF